MEKSQCYTDPQTHTHTHTHTHTQENDKQILYNYRRFSLLPVCSIIFERLRYNSIYKHIVNNNFLSPNQSGFLHRRLMHKSAFVNYLRHFSLF